MKKNIFKKTLIILAISIVYSILIEKFLYPDNSFEIKRFLINFLALGQFIYIFSLLFKNKNIGCIIKVMFSTLVLLVASLYYKNTFYFSFGITEIVLILCLSNFITKKKPKLGMVINDILFLFLNIQLVMLLFSGSFLKLIMLTNLDSLEDLSGKTLIYGLGVVGLIVFSFIPVKKLSLSEFKKDYSLVIAIALEIVFILLVKLTFSPMGNYSFLIKEEVSYLQNSYALSNSKVNKKDFYKKDIKSYIDTEYNSDNKPNIILIFTEGLSQNVVLDKKNIMPNVKKYENKSINFTGYFNHTFATYRGLIGQLYSGYQYDNLDENHLTSIQDILKDNGYNTAFVNSEPKNKEFTKYLKSFKFDKVVSTKKTKGEASSTSDKDSYSLLFDTASNLNNKNKPFFASIYTFGTHVSLDSPDLKYGNGKDNFLNRFYNVDYQFGKFMEKFENSELSDNTIVVFTGDHCSYSDMDYKRVFPNYERVHTMVDPMPLFIYYDGVNARNIEVNGRNSLSLAPTILDYIDVSAPNYFLGESLFSGADGGTEFDHYYHDDVNWVTTFNKELKLHSKDFNKKIIKKIEKYLVISSK